VLKLSGMADTNLNEKASVHLDGLLKVRFANGDKNHFPAASVSCVCDRVYLNRISSKEK
jgi:hypothetical protein